MNLECDLKDELLCYEPDNDDERHCKRRMLAFLEVPQCFERSLDKDHFTASSWLIDKSANKVLLMHHRKLDKWLQLGGHADGDSNLLRVAIKEAQEESGIQDIKPVHKHIFDIDIHDVPGHRHFDVRFLLQVCSDEKEVQNTESKELRWFGRDLDALPTQNHSVLRMFYKWVAKD